MNFLSRLCTVRVVEFRYLNPRHYTRWSHRRPKRVLTPEEYNKLELNYQQDNTRSSDIQDETSFKSTYATNLNAPYTKYTEPFSEDDDEHFVHNTNKSPLRKSEKSELSSGEDDHFGQYTKKSQRASRNFRRERSEQASSDDENQFIQNKNKSTWIPKNLRNNRSDEAELRLAKLNLSELEGKSALYSGNSDLSHRKIKKKKLVYKTMKDVASAPRDMLETVVDADGNLVYTKLPDKDAGLSKVLVMVKTRSLQIKNDLALLEGKRLIKDALVANCKLKSMIFSRKEDVEELKSFLPQSGAKLYKIPYREIQMWSDLTTTPGIMGIFKTPNVENFVPPKDRLEIMVVCDNIREPGNLGAILRTALGAGIQSVVLTKGCVDLWDTKVLRSACGAHFQLQIHRKMNWTDIDDHLRDSNGSVLIADNKITTDDAANGSSVDLQNTISELPLLPYYGVNYPDFGPLVLIIGGETEGISGDAYRFAAQHSGLRLNIPLSNSVDSLNAGTSLGIILFEIKRQLARFKHDKVQEAESC